MTHPLVSVMTPCHNAARTLPRALASLVAQTYEDWECLLVDDGSVDDPLAVAERINDPRIRAIRLPENVGRGAARQVAMGLARGSLIAMLDADDWLYPVKLERQVEALTAEPGLSLVSAGMAIVDERNDLVGVRCRGVAGPLHPAGPVRRLGPPPVAFGPTMMRAEVARRFRFDPGLSACEDFDYLIRYLIGRRFATLRDVSYVYSEHETTTPEKAVRNMRTCRAVFSSHRDRFPFGSRWQVGKTLAKEIIYRGAFALGMGRRLVANRSAPPTAEDVREFQAARRVVAATVDRYSQTAAGGALNDRETAAAVTDGRRTG